jgi:hypothetical protein
LHILNSYFTDKDGYKSVAYDRLSAILVQVAKSQKRHIEEQQRIIDAQKLELENQKKEINKIKSILGL